MKFDFLSGPARRAVVAAQKLARAREQPEVELEHLTAALLEAPETAEASGAWASSRRRCGRRSTRSWTGLRAVTGEDVYLGAAVLRLLDIAQIDARERGAEKVEPIDLLLGAAAGDALGRGGLLRNAGLTLPRIEEATEQAARRRIVGFRGAGNAGGVAAAARRGARRYLPPAIRAAALLARPDAAGIGGRLDPVSAATTRSGA